MSNVDKAARIIRDRMNSSGVANHHMMVAQALAEAGLIAPTPRIIRTAEELKALDPETWTIDRHGDLERAKHWLDEDGEIFQGFKPFLPATVIFTAGQIRAVCEALKEQESEGV